MCLCVYQSEIGLTKVLIKNNSKDLKMSTVVVFTMQKIKQS